LKELEDSAGQKPTSSRNDLPIFISLLALALAILSFFT